MLTTIDIDNLQAGRQADALVAELVEGWRWATFLGRVSVLMPQRYYTQEVEGRSYSWQAGCSGEPDIEGRRFYDSRQNPPNAFPPVPLYSTRIEYAMPIAVRLGLALLPQSRADGGFDWLAVDLASLHNRGSEMVLRPVEGVYGSGSTPELAICKAALRKALAEKAPTGYCLTDAPPDTCPKCGGKMEPYTAADDVQECTSYYRCRSCEPW